MKITEVRLKNFKKFKELSCSLDSDRAIVVGDNESGKTSILSAIDLTLGASLSRIESLGLDTLFNKEVCDKFLAQDEGVEGLPDMEVEVFLDNINEPDLHGENNSYGKPCHGIKLICAPNTDYEEEIREVLNSDLDLIPFEFYKISFETFAGHPKRSFRKYFNYLHLDTTTIDSAFAAKSYVKQIYDAVSTESQRCTLSTKYRSARDEFSNKELKVLPAVERSNFSLRNDMKSSLDQNLIIEEDGINLEQKGKGRQVYVKTDFALNQQGDRSLDFILIEEPENHLSILKLRELIENIDRRLDAQLVITTHHDLVTSGLGLNNLVFLSSERSGAMKLSELSSETSKFFKKSTNNNILQFCLSSKVILVEGNAEYILLPKVYEVLYGRTLEQDNIVLISVGGLSFKRYLEVSLKLESKVAVITDNDGDFKKNIIRKYSDYLDKQKIKISYHENEAITTFEVALFEENKRLCERLFQRDETLNYMLNNKSEASFKLVSENPEELMLPQYIRDAFEWIRN